MITEQLTCFLQEKKKHFPRELNIERLRRIKNFKQYDDRFTAPLHGFKDAEDYWRQCSSLQFVQDIKVPTLIVSALNDPFLSESCFPCESARNSDYVYLETPDSGGHVGFVDFNPDKTYWSENRAIRFLKDN